MSYGTVVMRISIFFLFNYAFLRTNGEVSYVPKITDSVFSCEDFDNDFLDCDDLVLGSLKGDDGDDAAKLGGKIKTAKDIVSDYDVEIDIWKILDMGMEYMYNTRMNFCSSLKNTDAPWYPVIEKLNISDCPVPGSIFEVQDLTVSLDGVKDVMSHDFCGMYHVQLSFMDVNEKISCHIIELCIMEQND